MVADIADTSVEALEGSTEEALGKLTGDTRVEAEGRRQKLAAARKYRMRHAGPGRPR